ncbi:bifunctional 6-phosphofructo-2-kinase/fructose-2,6-bisphosphate 2-phosphatase, partial [Nadsonia fulvescens var. elongata DSM 6958]
RATTLDIPGLTKSKVSPDGTVSSVDLGSKLVIVMVGLPARGKSYITNKLCRYLTWQQHRCKIFNVGNTRQQLALNEQHGKQRQKPKEEEVEQKQEHDAAFFSPNNKEYSTLRESWAMDTLDQLLDYILIENGTVGILDATNTTRHRRSKVLEKISERTQGRLRVLFLESICTQPETIERNIRLKLSGPDYKDIDTKKALSDFVGRLRNYEKAYETIDDNDTESNLQYCKIINAGARTITNNIKGFLSGQAVFFMLNFNLSERQIWICRHGESEDNVVGRIGGDSNLTVRGKKFAKTLTKFIEYQKKLFFAHQIEKMKLEGHLDLSGGSTYTSGTTTPIKSPGSPISDTSNDTSNDDDCESNEEDPVELNFSVWSSMMRRAVQTTENFNEENFDVKQMRMLNEIGAGNYDGMTYAEIRRKHPTEYDNRMSDKIHYRYPGMGGESYLDVIARLRQVIVEIERMEDHALIIAHRVVCRVLLAYFMNLSRDSIGDLDVPLHTLYVLEPKPYGVNWEMYEYSEKADWFFKVPKESISRRV